MCLSFTLGNPKFKKTADEIREFSLEMRIEDLKSVRVSLFICVCMSHDWPILEHPLSF